MMLKKIVMYIYIYFAPHLSRVTQRNQSIATIANRESFAVVTRTLVFAA